MLKWTGFCRWICLCRHQRKLYALSMLKLREIDLSKISSGSKIQHFAIQCPHLEEVTSNDIKKLRVLV
jgi:hypothetical protein